MSSIPDGSYHLYTTDKTTRPIVCEIMAGYVAQAGEEGWRPLSSCPGRLVRLREVQTLDEEQEIIAAFVRQVYRRAEHNMATNGTVSGAHWNAIRQELVARGIAEPTSNEPN